MESILNALRDLFDFVVTYVVPHWPFIMWLMLAMLIGQIVKKALFTKHNAVHEKPQWFWKWGRKTLALHPVAVGSVIGILWVNPEGADPAWDRGASMAYFAFAGMLSVWSYEMLKGAFRKEGINISLPGLSESPPPLDETDEVHNDAPDMSDEIDEDVDGVPRVPDE